MNSVIGEDQLNKVADTLKAVSHPVRLRIIEMLEMGERSVTEMVWVTGSRSTTRS